MAVYRASVYVGSCNPVRVMLNAEASFDWASISGMSVRVGDVTIDSSTDPGLITWAPSDHPDGGLEVKITLGTVLAAGLNSNLELTVRYVGCDAGHVWIPEEGAPDQLRIRSYA